MDLGKFSISLPVRDIAASRAFYECLGFAVTGGDADEEWLICVNGATVIGLFQGMFDRPMLTFNPGIDDAMGEPDDFTDVREIQQALQAVGIELGEETDPDGAGPGHLSMVDPDGHPILVDQHRPRPEPCRESGSLFDED